MGWFVVAVPIHTGEAERLATAVGLIMLVGPKNMERLLLDFKHASICWFTNKLLRERRF